MHDSQSIRQYVFSRSIGINRDVLREKIKSFYFLRQLTLLGTCCDPDDDVVGCEHREMGPLRFLKRATNALVQEAKPGRSLYTHKDILYHANTRKEAD